MSTDEDRAALHRHGRCDVVVEIPRGSRNKYEASEDGTIWFDRRLGGPAGFPGVHMRCRVVGAFVLGVGEIAETKLIAVPDADHHADHLRDLFDFPDAFLEELGAFFTAYRMLESVSVEVRDRPDRSAALAVPTGD